MHTPILTTRDKQEENRTHPCWPHETERETIVRTPMLVTQDKQEENRTHTHAGHTRQTGRESYTHPCWPHETNRETIVHTHAGHTRQTGRESYAHPCWPHETNRKIGIVRTPMLVTRDNEEESRTHSHPRDKQGVNRTHTHAGRTRQTRERIVRTDPGPTRLAFIGSNRTRLLTMLLYVHRSEVAY